MNPAIVMSIETREGKYSLPGKPAGRASASPRLTGVQDWFRIRSFVVLSFGVTIAGIPLPVAVPLLPVAGNRQHKAGLYALQVRPPAIPFPVAGGSGELPVGIVAET